MRAQDGGIMCGMWSLGGVLLKKVKPYCIK